MELETIEMSFLDVIDMIFDKKKKEKCRTSENKN
jgi:hypothetical protein